ncbi:MAG: acetate--CoA ligase family protein [Myxococcota bacterium]
MNDTDASLDVFFAPRSVAVVGASSEPSSVGHALLRNLLFGEMEGEDRGHGFDGPVHAVNPKGGEILGQRVYRSLEEIGERVDLVVVAIPPRHIPDVVEQAGDAGARGIIVISAGFAEMGDEGRALQNRMRDAARRRGVRMVGPNCLGVMRPPRLNASFAAQAPPAGAIGLLSQSGALVTGIITETRREGFGLSTAVSLGAKADVEDEDVVRWLGRDDATRALAIYVEAFREPRAFFEAARRITRHKPVVAIKGGTTAAGAKAASSHTGSLAGSGAAYEAAFAQAGVLQARTVGDFIGWSHALACQPAAPGRRIAILTNAGGPGVLAADAAVRYGMELAELDDATVRALNGALPAVWSHNNPVDVIGDATPERYREALDILGKAEGVDGIVVLLTVQAMTDPLRTARAIAEAHDNPSWRKPLLCSFFGLIGTEAGSYLDRRGIPEFNTPERAVSAMGALVQRGRWLRRRPAEPPARLDHPEPRVDEARRAVKTAATEGQRNLDLDRARQVLEAAGIRYNESDTAASEDEAVRIAERIGYPVAVKVVSPDVLHKSDVGGVVLDVVGADEVRDACRRIRARVGEHQPEARITGFTIEEQVTGTEIIVGMSRDPDFGPLLMVGMGGVFVEVYKDVAFRLVPLERRDALDMIDAIQAQPLLDGARNRPVLDRPELAEILLRVSHLVESVPQIEELDVNPLVITERGLVAIDARVIVSTSQG